jgi:uncharacterized cupredoxin-like copper-binding protein
MAGNDIDTEKEHDMKRSHARASFAAAAIAVVQCAAAQAHDQPHFSAGEPGDPKKPARVVNVTMREIDGKMTFVPARIEVRRGEQVRFLLRNAGELDHEFLLATTEENLKHAEEMKKNPEMEHDEPNGKRVAPKKSDQLVWRFSKRGEFEYGCLIPGHREAGMTGIVVVK